MNLEQAISIIKSVSNHDSLTLSKKDHIAVEQAVLVIEQLIKKPEENSIENKSLESI